MNLMRVIGFVRDVDELTKTGHVSIADASAAVLARRSATELLTLRDAAIDLQQVAEQTLLERDRVAS